MPRVNIWLPDELHRLVKEAEIPVSETCQEALRVAVGKVARRRLSELAAERRQSPTIRRQ